MAKTNPGPPAGPRLSTEGGAAPTELVDGEDWLGVTATEDYVGQRAEGIEFADVRVVRGRWSGVTIDGLRAIDVAFADCDLSGFVLQDDSSLRRVSFARCRLTGAVFAGAHLRDVSFSECGLDEANFRMSDLRSVVFDRCSLTGADFYGAKVEGLRATTSDFRGVDLTKASLSSADLRNSRLEDVRGADALRGATIDSTQVIALARSLAVALQINVVDADDG